MSPLADASIWLLWSSRALLDDGRLARWIAADLVRGVVFDPASLVRAFEADPCYRGPIRQLAHHGWDAAAIEASLVREDVRGAADALLGLYEKTGGSEGYAVLPLGPGAPDDASRLLDEASGWWESVNRPNLILELPPTAAGIEAMGRAIESGINVGVGPILGPDRHAEALEAYLAALEQRRAAGLSIVQSASAVSVSLDPLAGRVEAALTQRLRSEPALGARVAAVRGRTAPAIARLVWSQSEAAFSDDRFRTLAEHGSRRQRVRWALPAGSDQGFMAAAWALDATGAVFTVRPEHLPAFVAPGPVERLESQDLATTRAHLDALHQLEVSLSRIAADLEAESVGRAPARWSESRRAARQLDAMRNEVAPLHPVLEECIHRCEQQNLVERIWQGDAGLWTADRDAADEVRNRLGWLRLPRPEPGLLDDLRGFADAVRQDGIRHAVLLGMGGSSLAADVLRRSAVSGAGLGLHVLDSVDPAEILECSRRYPPQQTLYVVSSKSGTTAEPLALLEHFWSECQVEVGERCGSHFVAITDAGTPLEALARERGFRRVFAGPADVGGRYSALSVFGLVPAALMGIDLADLLHGATRMAHACLLGEASGGNPGMYLGAALAAASRLGRDQLTFWSDPDVAPLEDWIEQLIAESTGKQGKGLVPVLAEPSPCPPDAAQHRLFVYLRRGGRHDRHIQRMTRPGHPALVVEVGEGANGLGAEFFRWEFGVAVACALLGVDAFDQPDVQRSKVATLAALDLYQGQARFPLPRPAWEEGGTRVYAARRAGLPDRPDLASIGRRLRGQVRSGETLCWMGFLPRAPEVDAALRRLRRSARGIATTVGFGPRYLHSTGQLHKGGPDRVVLVIFVADPVKDLAIPNRGYTFGALARAQAVGDFLALKALGRRVVLVHLDSVRRMTEVARRLGAGFAE